MLISAVMPIMTIYSLPHGQLGYRGHVVNLPQDCVAFCRNLPRSVANLDVIIVRRERANQSHSDFHVRRRVVQHAIQWLIDNNAYYQANHIHIDESALAQLPEDGNLDRVRSITVNRPVAEADGGNLGDSTENSAAGASDDLTQSFVPSSVQSMTEQEAIAQSIEQSQSNESTTPPPLAWPSIGTLPINEFTTEGYFSCAFPTLFPTGAADFLGQRHNRVTIGNYFKHLMMFDDGRFAKHPRFRFFALNTEMRRRALQAGRIYVRQHPGDAQLTVDELRDMVGHREGDTFSSRVVRYASSIRGTKLYWFQQRSRLLSMVDTLGLPTIFFTHSAADLQWPELARLLCPDDPESPSSRKKAVIQNPAIADWFFHHRILKFVQVFYVSILGATDYWMRFEWQHRGSPHVHGLAWLPDAPDVEKLLSSSPDNLDTAKQIIAQYADRIVSTCNPGVLPDGSNLDDAPPARTNPHICNQAYNAIQDLDRDLVDLVATCQRHTRSCSPAYCLRTRHGRQECRFGYPKKLQPDTALVSEDGESEPTLLTARNDSLVNSFNPLQLSAWRANVDMQYIVSRRKVIEYCTKYVTKSEPRSQPLKDVFTTIVRSLKDGNTSLTAVQKLLIDTVGQRDYSAQETCHLLLQLPMFKSSREFVNLSLDGSRAVESALQDEQRATTPSILDHYLVRPSTSPFRDMTLLEFAQRYSLPKTVGAPPNPRKKHVIVTPRPYCSPEPSGPKYEQFCRQSLRQVSELLAGHDTYTSAYAEFLQSAVIQPSLEDTVHRLHEQNTEDHDQV